MISDISAFPERDGEFESVQHSLLEAVVFDPAKHPERSGTTLARITEVLGIILGPGDRGGRILAECKEASGEVAPFDALSLDAAIRVSAVLLARLEAEEVSRVADFLMESELSTREVIELHRTFKIPVSRLEDDLLPVNGQGACIQDSRGRVYVDLDSNYSATNLGNANPAIAKGLYNQARLLISQKEDRIQVARARFLKEIGGMMPEGLSRFYWQNSGGEAVDKALKIAKAYTGQRGVLSFEGGFHGRTHGAVAVTHNKAYREPFGLDNEDWVHFAPFNDLDAARKVLSEGKAKIVILELIQGEEGGMRPADPAFAKGLRKACDDNDAVMIVDEVQTGFARVADGPGQWFACQRYGITPDIITIGKSFGGGYPVTAVVTTPEISSKMVPGYDGSTFGGNPMAMTATLIATRQMKALDLPTRVQALSRYFDGRLSSIESDLLKGYRTLGLMVAADLDSPDTVKEVQELMKENRAHSSLSTGATIRLMPPLVITRAEIDVVVDALDNSLKRLEKKRRAE
ncbi:aminotransferase class III-fold pyridoxal phosphate-dependent enzyme [Candidatus Fermentibacteria bacterium]|nr:aminotransferase class III-fold pyridoxal phosphate-dependent enzyme [Candidatus Fermentibacteria bacterium]